MRYQGTKRPWVAILLTIFLMALTAAGCVSVTPAPAPPPPPPPPLVPKGLVPQPSYFAEDAHGNLWFTILGVPKVGRLNHDGSVSEFPLPPGISFAACIVDGPGGNMWMIGVTAFGGSVAGSIIKMTPAGATTFYGLPDQWVPEGLAVGPDGNLWFTGWDGAHPRGAVTVGRLTPAGVVTIFPMAEQGTAAANITKGPGNSLWFTEPPVARIGRISLDGRVVEYPLRSKTARPAQIVEGSDGNMWFTDNFSDRVTQITPQGMVTEFTLPVAGDFETIVSGPDGNLWIALNQMGKTRGSAAGAIVRLTTKGAVTVFPIPGGAYVTNLIARHDGTLWFSERWKKGGPTNIGKITTAGKITLIPLKLND